MQSGRKELNIYEKRSLCILIKSVEEDKGQRESLLGSNVEIRIVWNVTSS